MSHFTTLKTRIVSREHLLMALKDLGYEFDVGALNIEGFQGRRTDVEIRVPARGPNYAFGFRKQGETFEIVADWWGIHDLKEEDFLTRLTQRYAYRVVQDQLKEQDFTTIEEEVQADNTIHMVVRRMA